MAQSATLKRIGFLFPAKKLSSGGFDGFVGHARLHGYEIVTVEPDRCIEEQGPFDIIVQKLNESMVAQSQGNEEGARRVADVKDYLARHPHLPVVDPLDSLSVLLDRKSIAIVLEDIAATSGAFRVPQQSLILLDLRHGGVQAIQQQMQNIHFPVLCKRIEACSTQASHEMVWVANKQLWADLLKMCSEEKSSKESGVMSLPFEFGQGKIALQQCINHNGVLYKVYVCGDVIHTALRPSLANVTPEYPLAPVAFDSQRIPKKFVTVDHSDPVSVAFLSATPETQERMKACLDHNKIKAIVQLIRDCLNLTLFGVDVLRSNDTGEYYVVDFNYFPGFQGLPNFHEVFLDVIRKRLN